MRPVQHSIAVKLHSTFGESNVSISDESYMHSGPSDAESHFKVVVVSDQFDDLRLVRRHQLIYGLLSQELAGPVHALALHTYTQNEWRKKAEAAPESPNCLGAS
ncbi:MAG: BolA/IbaG family iron-sulfur metabolism protein [Porticoccaceae bacterium]|nr:BolA/IbaG family iron-sulfur metabolism protein [Porticoccaceae bacterium]